MPDYKYSNIIGQCGNMFFWDLSIFKLATKRGGSIYLVANVYKNQRNAKKVY